MSTLKEFAQTSAELAIKLAEEQHRGQENAMARLYIEKAVESFLEAKRQLMKAHQHLNGDEPMTGVA